MNKTAQKWVVMAFAMLFITQMHAQTTTVNLDIPIVSGNDDAEEFPSGFMILGSSDIEMVNDNGSDVTGGFRFQNVLLPANATVNNAYLQFYVDEVQTGTTSLTISGQKSGNAAPFTTAFNSLTGRTFTNSNVSWSPDPWTSVGTSGAGQESPDLTAVVQEIITSGEWTSGDAMAFFVQGSGLRTAVSYNKNASQAARLIIEAEVELNTNPISGVVINEVAPYASDYVDGSGKKEDWIELYNTTNETIQLGGLYLSDKASSPDKWQIPAGINIGPNQYVTFFADGDPEEGALHADFSFKAGGEDAVLAQETANGIEILDQVSFEDIAHYSTFGRIPNGTGNFVKIGTPTPNASNNGSLLYLEPPVIALESGVYQGSQTTTISHPDASATIRYTTDGSDPSGSSAVFNGSLSISSSQAVRAIAVRSGYQNSAPANSAYLLNENPNMDVIFITTDPDNFFDDQIGIYVDGTNGVQGYCAPYPVNWAQDWERPANFKMFTPDGSLAWDVNAGIEINGVCSRNNEMKSLGINLRDKDYGSSAIEYELYPTRDHEDYQRLKLRNSGQDFIRMGFRDMLNQQLVIGQVDLDMLEGIPTLVFLNGEFWGIHNLREKFSGEYFEAIYDVKEKDLDVIKSPGIPWQEVKEGTDEIYMDLFNFVQGANMNNPSDLQYFEDNVDVNEFLNYWIFMTYLANYDWPANNLKVWRERKEGEKWRWGAEDTDGSTQNVLTDMAKPEYNTLASNMEANSSNWPNHSNSTLFLRKLIENPAYEAEWVQRTCSFIELFFNEATVNAKTDAMKALYQPNVNRHLDKWGYGNALGGNVASWNSWIDFYKDFFADRPAYYRQFMIDQYGISGTYELNVNFNASTGGTVKVNSNEMDLPFNYTGTYMRGLPVRLTAVADEGYTFLYWQETGDTNPVIDYVSNSNVTLTPVFGAGNCTEGNPCNDGDDCTDNDVFDADCNCAGTFADADNDGVCDADDQCPGFDDNLDANNNGIPDDCEGPCTDNDGDGVCAEDDCNDNNPNLPAPVGTACNDGNPNTENDMIQNDGCSCAGTPINTGSYCDSNGDFPWHEWISGVNFGSINNSSSKGTYSNFTGISTTITPGQSLPIDIQASFSWETWDEHFNVWIDFNQNNVFEGSELIFSSTLNAPPGGTPSASVNGLVTMPAFNANGSTTRMRVSMQRGSSPSPCGVIPFGEVEDYTVTLGVPGPNNRVGYDAGELVLYPIPANQKVQVLVSGQIEVEGWTVYDAAGLAIQQEGRSSINNRSIELDVSEWNEGVYFIHVEVAQGKWRYGKIIVSGTR